MSRASPEPLLPLMTPANEALGIASAKPRASAVDSQADPARGACAIESVGAPGELAPRWSQR